MNDLKEPCISLTVEPARVPWFRLESWPLAEDIVANLVSVYISLTDVRVVFTFSKSPVLILHELVNNLHVLH